MNTAERLSAHAAETRGSVDGSRAGAAGRGGGAGEGGGRHGEVRGDDGGEGRADSTREGSGGDANSYKIIAHIVGTLTS